MGPKNSPDGEQRRWKNRDVKHFLGGEDVITFIEALRLRQIGYVKRKHQQKSLEGLWNGRR